MLKKSAYDMLPYAYFGAALLDAALLQSPVKYLSSVLFVVAGLLVLSWRKAARERQRRQSAGKAQARHQRHAHLTPWLG